MYVCIMCVYVMQVCMYVSMNVYVCMYYNCCYIIKSLVLYSML